MKDLQKDLKMIISTNISETEKDEWIEKLVNGYIDQQKALIIDDVSQQRELLLAYEEYTSYKVLGKKTPRISKQMVEDYLANNCD